MHGERRPLYEVSTRTNLVLLQISYRPRNNAEWIRLGRAKKTLEHGADLVREPGDEPKLVEVRGHSNQSSKPRECIPGTIVAEALLPGHDSGDEQHCKAAQRGRNVVHANGSASHPEGHCSQESCRPAVPFCRQQCPQRS
jgi:hypothetical protein